MEEVCDVKSRDHVAVFSNNQPTVSWVDLLESNRSVAAGHLLRALALILGHSVGSVVFGENLPYTPTVFRMKWPEWVKIEITSSSNCTGTLKNSDFKMAGLL